MTQPALRHVRGRARMPRGRAAAHPGIARPRAPRPAQPRRRRDSRRGALVAAAVLAAAFLLWFLWPADPIAPAPVAPAASPTRAATSPGRKPIVRKAPPPPPQAPRQEIDEARLRAAVLARAPDLRSCAVPTGAPSQVPVQLAIRASGEVRTVRLVAPESVPPMLATCLHERLLHWRFDDVHLASDIHLVTAFALR